MQCVAARPGPSVLLRARPTARLTASMLRRGALDLLNRALDAVGLRLLPRAHTEWFTVPATFRYRDRVLPYFRHAYNCGWPPYVTERTVEMALADAWLRHLEQTHPDVAVLEIGAVTPYYWPGRIARVVDPHDEHRLVTDRRSVMALDLVGETVLSISTLEHVGRDEYGEAEAGASPLVAVDKVLDEAERLFVTLPVGTEPDIDAWLFDGAAAQAGCDVGFLVRRRHGTWAEVGAAEARLPYGDQVLIRRFPDGGIGRWANAVAVVVRGGDLLAHPRVGP